jgi:ABC-type multidrug transport system fused ATPase/permease subunit
VLLVTVALGGYVFASAVERAGGALRKLVFDRLQRMPLSWFESGHSGDALSRLTNDMQAAQQAWGWQLVRPAMATVSGLGSGVIMFLLDWRAALLCISLGLLGLWIDSRFVGPLKRESDGVQRALGGAVERLSDTLAAATVIKIFNLRQWVMDRFEKAADRILTHELRRARWSGGQAGVNAFVLSFSFVGLCHRLGIRDSGLVGVFHPGGHHTAFQRYLAMFSGWGTCSPRCSPRWPHGPSVRAAGRAGGGYRRGRPLGEGLRAERFGCGICILPTNPVTGTAGRGFHIHPGETVAIVAPAAAGKARCSSC